jgi:hypothetical protein
VLDIPIAVRKSLQPDLYPNLSAQTETVPVPRAPLYINGPWKSPVQVDVYPNIALSAAAPAIQVLRPALYVNAPWKSYLQPDLYPNIAILIQGAIGNITVFYDLPPIRALQPDLYPNLAATAAPPGYMPKPALDVPITAKAWWQPEISPNIAVKFQTAITSPGPQAVEPPITKRYPPQVEIFQNQAIYVTQVTAQLPAPIEPTFTLKVPLLSDIYPNIAVNFNNIAAPSIDTHDGGTQVVRESHYKKILRPKKLKGQVIQRADLVAEAVMPLSANKMPTRIIQNNVVDDEEAITVYLTHETIELDSLADIAEGLTKLVK